MFKLTFTDRKIDTASVSGWVQLLKWIMYVYCIHYSPTLSICCLFQGVIWYRIFNRFRDTLCLCVNWKAKDIFVDHNVCWSYNPFVLFRPRFESIMEIPSIRHQYSSLGRLYECVKTQEIKGIKQGNDIDILWIRDRIFLCTNSYLCDSSD